MEEEDLYLVIVGDPSVTDKQDELLVDKSSENEIDANVLITSLYQEFAEHQEFLLIKEEQVDATDQLDEGDHEVVIKNEGQQTENLKLCKVVSSHETKEIPSETYDSEDAEYQIVRCKKTHKAGKRRKQPAAQERYSLVEKLRKTCPELEDEQLLVDTVREIMGTVKRPELPPDHYSKQAQNKYKCTVCEHVSISEAAAGRHYEELHGPHYLSCFACGMEFRCKYNLYRHEKKCLSPDAGVVLKARNLYLGRNTKIRPYIRDKYKRERNLSNSIYKCVDCSKVFEARLDLFIHMSTHGRIVHEYQCPHHHCSANFQMAKSLKNHIRSQHSGKKFICDYCNRTFKKKINIINHLDTHLPQKKYACTDCPKRYSTKFALSIHVNRIHKNLPPPCVCEVCTKRYNRISQLKLHMKKEHDITLITEKMLLKKEVALELQLNKKARLVTKAELERLNVETAAQYYQDQIDKEVSKQIKKRFVCDDCGKIYAGKTDLKVHIETEHLKTVRPVTCAICHLKYRRLSLLKKHMKRKHGMMIITKEKISKTLPKLSEEQRQDVLVVFNNGE